MDYKPIDSKDLEFFRSWVEPNRFSTGESNLTLHSRDESLHGPHVPEAVLWPLEAGEVSEALKYCNARRIPVTGWGVGSSLEGNPLPVAGGLVMNFSRMNRILEVRSGDFQADLEPGVVYKDLNERLRHEGLFFPPDPGASATIGGMIANNASGTRTVHYGSTRDYVLQLEIVLADGQIICIGTRASKSSSGYDLVNLFVGSEGTLGLFVKATIKLVGYPGEYSAAVVSFESVKAAGQTVFEIMRAGMDPAALELLDKASVELLNREVNFGLPPNPALLMEFHGPDRKYLGEVIELVKEMAEENGGREFSSGLGREERDRIWHARHKIGEITNRVHPGTKRMILDVAVPAGAFPEMIALSEKTIKDIGLPGYIVSHAGDGNLHVVVLGKQGDPKEWAAIDELNDTIVRRALELGGTATGEHGVGLGKRGFMKLEHRDALEWMQKIKRLFDPHGILNPGKIF
jgi:D-lactate dehydrogenase (cytochrome)